MQAGRGPAAKPPIGIAFEGDLGNRIDALLAVAMLNGFTGKGEARKIALSISRPSLKAAQLADVALAFYGGRAIAGPGGGVGGSPDGMVGVPEGASFSTDNPPLAAILTKKTAEGAPQFVRQTAGAPRLMPRRTCLRGECIRLKNPPRRWDAR